MEIITAKLAGTYRLGCKLAFGRFCTKSRLVRSLVLVRCKKWAAGLIVAGSGRRWSRVASGFLKHREAGPHRHIRRAPSSILSFWGCRLKGPLPLLIFKMKLRPL